MRWGLIKLSIGPEFKSFECLQCSFKEAQRRNLFVSCRPFQTRLLTSLPRVIWKCDQILKLKVIMIMIMTIRLTTMMMVVVMMMVVAPVCQLKLPAAPTTLDFDPCQLPTIAAHCFSVFKRRVFFFTFCCLHIYLLRGVVNFIQGTRSGHCPFFPDSSRAAKLSYIIKFLDFDPGIALYYISLPLGFGTTLTLA